MTHRFGVLWCEDSSKWVGQWCLYQKALGRPDASSAEKSEVPVREEWEVFDVCAGQLPSIESIMQYTGFVISGSRWSSYDDLPWIKRLHEWIRSFHQVSQGQAQGPCMVGICFGHQAIGDALGGRVASNGRFVIGLEKLRPTEAFADKPYVKMALRELGWNEVPASINLLESHGDAVHELPTTAELLASSASTAVEMFTINDRIIGIQGHPEFFPQLLKEKILDDMVDKGKISSGEAADVERRLEEALHHAFLCKVLQNFLRQYATPCKTSALSDV